MGLEHCHANGVVVCDLKPQNVILVQDGGGRFVAKLADFGLACGIGRTRPARCGTIGYMPHEVAFEDTVAETSADILSLGAMLAYVALNNSKREFNVFCHEAFRTEPESMCLLVLASHGEMEGHYWKLVESITWRTMTKGNDDYIAKAITRPAMLHKMPGTATVSSKNISGVGVEDDDDDDDDGNDDDRDEDEGGWAWGWEFAGDEDVGGVAADGFGHRSRRRRWGWRW